tara:strand:+ start:8766 stop:9833 length:1068 start_codon:yes stop_codon:yes gene_type:complete
MKVSIGTNVKDGPWGGGNLFAINLTNYLKENNHEVIYNLDDDDIDIILLTEPRKTSESSAFTHLDVNNYLKFKNSRSIVIHRINECDERKNTDYVNKYLINVNKSADFTVFVSTWLMTLFEKQGLTQSNKKVILAGANKEIFNKEDYIPWNQKEKLKIVTHHWGANWNKGFDTYIQLDEMMGSEEWKGLIEFTYIGNLPKNFKFENSIHIEPLSGLELARQIKSNHVYITGSLNEPSGNHHIEAAQCSLPVLFIDSGGIPEYCDNYGVKFDNSNFQEQFKEMYLNYDKYLNNMTNYPFNSDKMSQEYFSLFEKLLDEKNNVLMNRDISILEFSSFYTYKLKNLFKKFLIKLNFKK